MVSVVFGTMNDQVMTMNDFVSKNNLHWGTEMDIYFYYTALKYSLLALQIGHL